MLEKTQLAVLTRAEEGSKLVSNLASNNALRDIVKQDGLVKFVVKNPSQKVLSSLRSQRRYAPLLHRSLGLSDLKQSYLFARCDSRCTASEA
ncbi:hypothetical protein O988_04624 [Pseudogymnoascus sp. VKM F-3808]|nr:hypothetical protein O988_04624 [Pseudogymnoascus sp. VKM F-3808]